MKCHVSPKEYFRYLIISSLILMVISVFKFNQDFSRSITLSAFLRLNGSGLYPRSRFTPPIPLARWNMTSLLLNNDSIVRNVITAVSTPQYSHSNLSASSRPLSCSPVQNIAYIKTLKTGSTSVQTILNRYGFFHNLSFILNRQSSKNGHFYHLPFTEKMAETHFLPPIHVAANDYPNFRNYNMMAVHVRYQRDAMEQYFAQGTQYISIIRDPGMQWESAFNHFRFYDAILSDLPAKSKSSGVDNSTDATMGNGRFVNDSLAFRGCSIFGEKSRTKKGESNSTEKNCTIPELIEVFMQHPDYYRNRLNLTAWENVMGKRWAYARNNQIYDLGLDPKYHDNVTAVKEWIQTLESEFSLILINEYFDESLLVMRKIFCWNFTDIVYIAKNVRINTGGVSITDDLRDKIRKWNSADMLMYAHFNRTLWRLIVDYGPNFDSDLKYFRNLLETVLQNCTKATTKKLWNRDHLFGHYEREPRPHASLFCQTVAETKTQLHYRIYCRQDIKHTAKACKGPKKTVKRPKKPSKGKKYHKHMGHVMPPNNTAKHPAVTLQNLPNITGVGQSVVQEKKKIHTSTRKVSRIHSIKGKKRRIPP